MYKEYDCQCLICGNPSYYLICDYCRKEGYTEKDVGDYLDYEESND